MPSIAAIALVAFAAALAAPASLAERSPGFNADGNAETLAALPRGDGGPAGLQGIIGRETALPPPRALRKRDMRNREKYPSPSDGIMPDNLPWMDGVDESDTFSIEEGFDQVQQNMPDNLPWVDEVEYESDTFSIEEGFDQVQQTDPSCKALNEYWHHHLKVFTTSAQNLVERALIEIAAVRPWVEGMYAGIMGDNDDVRREKLYAVWMASFAVYESIVDSFIPFNIGVGPIELTDQQLSRERTILYLLQMLVTVSHPPIKAVEAALLRGEDFCVNRKKKIPKWKNRVGWISWLVGCAETSINPSPTVSNHAAQVIRMSDVIKGQLSAMALETPTDFVARVRRPDDLLAELSSLFAQSKFLAPRLPRDEWPLDYLLMDSAGENLVWVFRSAAAFFGHASEEEPPKSVIYFIPRKECLENLRTLRELVADAISWDDPEHEEPFEPIPDVPEEIIDDGTIRDFLKEIQSSLFRSLVARLPMPVGFPPLYSSTPDFFDEGFASRVSRCLHRVHDVVMFFVKAIDTSGSADYHWKMFSQVVSEALRHIRAFVDSRGDVKLAAELLDLRPDGIPVPEFENYHIEASDDYDKISSAVFF